MVVVQQQLKARLWNLDVSGMYHELPHKYFIASYSKSTWGESLKSSIGASYGIRVYVTCYQKWTNKETIPRITYPCKPGLLAIV